MTTSRADESSWPCSLLATTLYVPDNSVDAEVMVSFISRPLKEIIMSFDALTTVDSLRITTEIVEIAVKILFMEIESERNDK